MTLNIFNKHSDRVKMACIAQLINVLQSVMLTDGEKMIKTPTYHVFHMYRHHQGATLLRSDLIGAGTGGARGAAAGDGAGELSAGGCAGKTLYIFGAGQAERGAGGAGVAGRLPCRTAVR